MRKILSAVLLFLLLFFAAGCDSAPVMVPPSLPPYSVDYVLTQTEFEKDNVFLDVYYGRMQNCVLVENSTYRLFVYNDDAPTGLNEEGHFLIKEVTAEEFDSEKYLWNGTDGYHETMQLPEELFVKEEGTVYFCFIQFFPENQEYDGTVSSSVNYAMQNDIVILSDPRE